MLALLPPLPFGYYDPGVFVGACIYYVIILARQGHSLCIPTRASNNAPLNRTSKRPSSNEDPQMPDVLVSISAEPLISGRMITHPSRGMCLLHG